MAEPVGYLEVGPTRKPRRGGIKSVAEFVPTDRLMAVKALDWTNEPCTFPNAAPGLCWGTNPGGTKSFNGNDVNRSGDAFALYSGDECFAGGGLDYDSRARASLEQGEDRELEERLVLFLAAKDATPADFGGFAAGFAAAETAADNDYIGQPVIVMNRGDVSAAGAARVIFSDNEGNLTTQNGTPVLASGRVPAGDFYVTGQITVFTSPAIIVNRVIHHINNREMAIAERAYAFGIDCDYVVAYSVTEVP
jgi:hypothetical protein